MTKKNKDPLTCSKCKKTPTSSKYFPYCSLEHWGIAIKAEPK